MPPGMLDWHVGLHVRIAGADVTEVSEQAIEFRIGFIQAAQRIGEDTAVERFAIDAVADVARSFEAEMQYPGPATQFHRVKIRRFWIGREQLEVTANGPEIAEEQLHSLQLQLHFREASTVTAQNGFAAGAGCKLVDVVRFQVAAAQLIA